ncbi:hypothetical protein [Actimicrobium antarcticum]|uniref:DUF883 domain-containing protein n=1 Tax=Actimicrobium antarcticum TaxID=1051899 RepID=A0ABP7T6M0_9BURK
MHSENINNTIAANGAVADKKVDQAGASAQDAITSAQDTLTKLSGAARPAVERFTAGAHQAVEKLMSVANTTADTVALKSEQLMDAQERLVEDCRTYVRQKPVTSVAIAVGIGYLLSRLLTGRNAND